MTLRPERVLLPDGSELCVLWSDGHESYYPADLLRRSCPCAGCRSAPPPALPSPGAGAASTNPLRVLSAAEAAAAARGPLRIVSWDPVGRYAIHLLWSDGHSTGIYPFPMLRDLCPCAECRARV